MPYLLGTTAPAPMLPVLILDIPVALFFSLRYTSEMLTKPDITKRLSDSGCVFSPAVVAQDILRYSAHGYFGISTGLDGWLLKQLHPGMGPVNNWWEVVQGILFAPLCRLISLFYVIGWDMECKKAAATAAASASKANKATIRTAVTTRTSRSKKIT